MIPDRDGYVRLAGDAVVLDRFELTAGSRELDRWLARWRHVAGARVLIPERGTVAVVIADPTAELAPAIHPEQLRLDL